MSDTPKHQQAADGGEELGAELKWNSEADGYNQWDSLGENEKAELIAAFILANARDLAPPTKPLMAGYQQELCSGCRQFPELKKTAISDAMQLSHLCSEGRDHDFGGFGEESELISLWNNQQNA